MADTVLVELGKDGRRPVSLDIAKLIVTRMLVQANSGGGKSYAVRVLAEQAMNHVQTIVIDPDGEFASLREIHDVLLVGEDGDLPADPRGAALLARRLFEKRCSAVVDLYELDPAQREEFVRDFCDALVKIPKSDLSRNAHPMLVIIDEAQDFCPEKSRGTSVATKSVISLMARGRKRGMGVCLAAQRMSEINKSASSTVNNYLCGRTAQDTDRRRVAHDLGLEKNDQDGLRNLKEGEFWAIGPAFSHPDCRKIKVARAQTTHPEPGTSMPPPPPASKRIRAMIGREFSDLPEKAEEEAATLEQAQAELRHLRAENARLQQQPGNQEQVHQLHAELEGVQSDLESVRCERDILVELTRSAAEDLGRIKDQLTEASAIAPAVARETPPPSRPTRVAKPPSSPAAHHAPRTAQTSRKAATGLRPADQAVLDALAWWAAVGKPSPTRTQLAFVCKTHPRTKSHANRLSALKTAGLITTHSGTVSLTAQGRAKATHPALPGSDAELHEMVLSRLRPSMRETLQCVLKVYPRALSREALAIARGKHPRTKSHANELSALKSLGTLCYPQTGKVRASDDMFVSGRP